MNAPSLDELNAATIKFHHRASMADIDRAGEWMDAILARQMEGDDVIGEMNDYLTMMQLGGFEVYQRQKDAEKRRSAFRVV